MSSSPPNTALSPTKRRRHVPPQNTTSPHKMPAFTPRIQSFPPQYDKKKKKSTPTKYHASPEKKRSSPPGTAVLSQRKHFHPLQGLDGANKQEGEGFFTGVHSDWTRGKRCILWKYFFFFVRHIPGRNFVFWGRKQAFCGEKWCFVGENVFFSLWERKQCLEEKMTCVLEKSGVQGKKGQD